MPIYFLMTRIQHFMINCALLAGDLYVPPPAGEGEGHLLPHASPPFLSPGGRAEKNNKTFGSPSKFITVVVQYALSLLSSKMSCHQRSDHAIKGQIWLFLGIIRSDYNQTIKLRQLGGKLKVINTLFSTI